MEDDATVGKASGSDDEMKEGSDGEWDNVASGSENYGGDENENADGDQQEADADDDDDGGDEDDDDERDLIILCSRSLGRWERHEAVMEAAAAAEAGKQVLSTTQGLAAKRQIFNPREAFSMLSRELLDFMRARHVDCSVETGGDDVYHWIVDLGSFTDGSALARDMREISKRYCYSTVRLRMRFMRGLHPFFPPSVEVVWPHFAGPLLGAVASHPMLRLENWDPWRPAMDTVGQIKAFLEANARVDLDNPANDIGRHPESTYSPLERGLARLEALSGMPPICLAQPDIAALYAARDSYDKDAARLQALAEGGKKRSRSEPAVGKRTRDVVWARGTGYGSGLDKSSEQWDAKATEAAQRARDMEIQALIEYMYVSLVRELGTRLPLPMEAEDLEGKEQDLLEQRQNTATSGGSEIAEQSDGGAAGRGDADMGSSGSAAVAMEGVETASATDCGGSGTAPSGSRGASADRGDEETVAAASSSPRAATEAAGGAEAAPCGAVVATVFGAGGSGGGGAVVETDKELWLGPERCAKVLQDSCLLPFTVRELQTSSFTNMGARHKYYSALLLLLRELCRPGTHDMLWMKRHEPRPHGQQQHSCNSGAGAGGTGPGRSVAAIITTGLRSAARMYLNVLGPATVQTEGKSLDGNASTSISIPRVPDKVALAAENATREAEATKHMAKIIIQIAAYVDANIPQSATVTVAGVTEAQGQCTELQAGTANGMAVAVEADEDRAASGVQASCSAASRSSLYVVTMKPLQVDAVSGSGRAHHYASNVRLEQQTPRSRAVRLAKEVASLESLLPLSESSSVFVRVDETAVQLWKAIIIGPEDTPYSGGCFVFDLYFPPQYPNVAPQVHLMTTGGGRVRFNPNLYAEGKVCLSLLGTWSGDRGENWNPDISTAVQVLISIQSLIMVPEPYFNEPSYESQTGSRGKVASQEYNKVVRENCVRYAMLDVLRHPPAALADVVRTHFRLRRDAMLAQIKLWADEERATDTAYTDRLMDLCRELEVLIGSLH